MGNNKNRAKANETPIVHLRDRKGKFRRTDTNLDENPCPQGANPGFEFTECPECHVVFRRDGYAIEHCGRIYDPKTGQWNDRPKVEDKKDGYVPSLGGRPLADGEEDFLGEGIEIEGIPEPSSSEEPSKEETTKIVDALKGNGSVSGNSNGDDEGDDEDDENEENLKDEEEDEEEYLLPWMGRDDKDESKREGGGFGWLLGGMLTVACFVFGIKAGLK